MRQNLYLDPCPWCGWLCCEEDEGAIKVKEVYKDYMDRMRPIATRLFCSQSCHDAWYYGP